MKTAWSHGKAPAAAALATVLRTAGHDVALGTEPLAKPVHVVSYKADFAWLWKSFDDLLSHSSPSLDLVIIWDGVLDDDAKTAGDITGPAINVANYVTAFDWIVALCCAAAEKKKKAQAHEPNDRNSTAQAETNQSLPSLRLHILDLEPPKQALAFGVRNFPDYLPKMPWVRVYRPVARFEGQGRTLASQAAQVFGQTHDGASDESADPPNLIADRKKRLEEYQSLIHPLLGSATLDIAALLKTLGVAGQIANLPCLNEDQRLADTAEALKAIWRGELSKPEGRHSIANLIGPQFLLSGMKAPIPQTGDLRTALQALLEHVDLVMPAAGAEPGPWIPRERWEDFVDAYALVDDMAHQGWADFLQAALGIRDLQCTHDDSGLRRLVNALIDAGLGIQIDDKLTWSEAQEALHECIRLIDGTNNTVSTNHDFVADFFRSPRAVVFLDLRLFNQYPDRERAYFTVLLTLAKKATQHNNLPWGGFSPEELEAVQHCIDDRDSQTDNYHLALTLLPRLLSSIAPTLPIILFSSTGQKFIIDTLAPYRNIVTGFDKPRFVASALETIVSDTKAKFVRAFNEAMVLARGRCWWLDVCSEHDKACANRINGLKAVLSEGRPGFFRLFLDESGTVAEKNYSVGGVLLGFQSKDAADQFDQTLRDNGLIWGVAEGQSHGHRILFRGETEEDAFKHVGREAGAVAFASQTVF